MFRNAAIRSSRSRCHFRTSHAFSAHDARQILVRKLRDKFLHRDFFICHIFQAEGNVLSILILAAAAGIALTKMPSSDKKDVVMKGLFGLQDLLFMLIHGLIWALPLGIVAFAAQLSAQFSAGIVMASLGKYVAVILGGNVIQFFIILPLFKIGRASCRERV